MYCAKYTDNYGNEITIESPTSLVAFIETLRADGDIKEGTEVEFWEDDRQPPKTQEEIMQEEIAEAVEAKTQEITQEMKELKQSNEQLKDDINEKEEAMNALNDRFNSVTFPPKKGEEWSKDKSYLKGDKIFENGEEYEALKYSKDKRPSTNGAYWRKQEIITPKPPTTQKWSDIEDGTWIKAQERVRHDGFIWVCTRTHKKASIWTPSTLSDYWFLDRSI